jgi:hypothetical protein
MKFKDLFIILLSPTPMAPPQNQTKTKLSASSLMQKLMLRTNFAAIHSLPKTYYFFMSYDYIYLVLNLANYHLAYVHYISFDPHPLFSYTSWAMVIT